MNINSQPSDWRGKIYRQAEAFGLKSKQVLDVIALTRSVIKEELQTEFKSGRYKPALQFLLDQSVRHGKNVLFDKIIQKVASRLILRLGLPGGLAVSVATLIVPILLKGISKKALRNVRVQEFINRLDKNGHLPDLSVVKNIFQRKDRGSEAA